MIEIRIGFGSVGIPGEQEIVANGDSLLERKLRVSRFYHFQDGESSLTGGVPQQTCKLPLFLGI